MLSPANYSECEKFAVSAATIAAHNFQWHNAAFVLFNSTLLCSVDIFLRSYQKNVIVGRGSFYPKFVSKTKQYVLFATDLQDVAQQLTWMQRHQFDNTGAFIVVCQSKHRKNCNESHAVNIFWNYKIINIVLIIKDRKENELTGYTYFDSEDCKNTRPSKVKNWDSCFIHGHLKCRNMFPPKLKNLHECQVIVSTFNQLPYMNLTSGIPTGSDGDLLRVVAKALNFTLKTMTPRIGNGWGKLEENGTWSGSLGDVYYEWANFSMTSACVTLKRFTTFQMSVDYAVVNVAWVTHPSEVEPSSLKLLRPFQAKVRIALCVSFIMVVVFTMSVKSNVLSSLKRKLNVVLPDGIIFHSWEICMGLPVNTFPANNALLCMTLFWIWYCFLIRTLYTVYLIDSLKTDVYSPEFVTIEEAIASKYPFGGGLGLRDYFMDYPLVYDDWLDVESNEIHPRMIKMSEGSKFVLAMNPETTKMFLKHNPNRNLHILPQVIITSPTVLFFKKYSPLANSLNSVLTRLKEAGVIAKIYSNNTGKKTSNECPDNNDIPISLGHYTGCYAVLFTGWLLSVLCFAVESLMPKKKY